MPFFNGLSRWSACASVAMFFITMAGSATATFPVVERLEPLGVQSGRETKVTFHGARLNDASEVISDDPRIRILDVKVGDGKAAEATIDVDDSVMPGLYPLRLVTRSGIANVRLLAVGRMPVTQEVEPNSFIDEAQSVEMNHTIEGVITNEDVDLFRVDLKEGQRLTVETEGIRLAFSLRNSNILDPFVAILDDEENEVASSDDSPLLQQDGLCTYTAPEAGTYTVMIRDSSFRGSDTSGYRLHVGEFPRPVAIYPAGGTPGSILNAEWIDMDGSVHEAQIQLPSLAADQHPIWIENDFGISPSPNRVRVNELPVIVEAEPNDDYRKAPQHEIPAAFCGVIGPEDEFDCFGFACQKGRKYRVEVFARHGLRNQLDAVLNVFGPDNRTLQSADDVGGKVDPFLEFSAKADGLHTIRIYDHLRVGDPTRQYRIEVTESTPQVELQLKELRRDEAMATLVPAGGFGAAVVTARRTDYGGPIGIELADLPPGVTATTFDIPSGRAEIPVLLQASEKTPVGSSLYTMTAIPGDEKTLNVGSRFFQAHKLVLGQNRRHMWATETDRAVCAVVEASPFDIELVQPKTPIVRQGSRDLKVRIKRHEGFEGEVSLRTLYNPPGISVNNSRKIAKDKTEVDIPITANSGAAVGSWPMILTATYGSKTGSQVVATNAIDLDVEAQFFKYNFPKAAAERGTTLTYAVNVEVLRDFDDEAEIELVGLPNGVTSKQAVQKLNKETTTVTFPIEIAADAKVGKHRTLVCVARLKRDGETIVQTTGTGEIRIDKPIAQPTESATNSKKSEKTKPLSRLEQLRQQRGATQ